MPHYKGEEDIRRVKSEMVKHREDGMDLVDCAELAGTSYETMLRWRKADAIFDRALQTAWKRYKKSLLVAVKRRDPKYLAQNDFPDRFKKDAENPMLAQLNQFFISYDVLTKDLLGINPRTIGSNSGSEAPGVTAGGVQATDGSLGSGESTPRER